MNSLKPMLLQVQEVAREFLERANRPGLLGMKGKAVQRRCEADLKAYFRELGAKIKALNLEQIVAGGMTAELARHAVEMRLHNLLRQRRPLLVGLLKTNLQDAIAVANQVHVLAEADGDLADPIGWTAEYASEWAATHTDELITGLDETTLQQISDAVATGIIDQLGVDGTAKLIQQAVDDMSTWRAEMIAATEMNDAMSQAFLQKLVNAEVEYKQWILGPDPCPECEENADASPIPMDEDFPSGDDAPPAHPNCVCALAGARAPEE